MDAEINFDFFIAFFLSALQHIIKNNAGNINKKAMDFGIETGTRLRDDFFAKKELFRMLDKQEIEIYIHMFFKYYFNVNIEIKNQEIEIGNIFKYSDYECCAYFFNGILNSIFVSLNSDIVFNVKNDGKIKYIFD